MRHPGFADADKICGFVGNPRARTGSLMTRRWRKPDSNHRSRGRHPAFSWLRFEVRAEFSIDWESSGGGMSRSSNLDLVTRYRRFESGFLQRRVCKPSVPRERFGSLQSTKLRRSEGDGAARYRVRQRRLLRNPRSRCPCHRGNRGPSLSRRVAFGQPAPVASKISRRSPERGG